MLYLVKKISSFLVQSTTLCHSSHGAMRPCVKESNLCAALFKKTRKPPWTFLPLHLKFDDEPTTVSALYQKRRFLKAPFNINWRRDRDSNPRYSAKSTIDFESTAFDHSAISPQFRICYYLFYFYFASQILKLFDRQPFQLAKMQIF